MVESSAMRWPGNVLLAVLMAPFLAAPAFADRAAVERAAYADLSMSAPNASFMTVCHGFGCQYRAEFALTSADHAAIRRLMAAGKGSAANERKAVASVGAWFDKRV